MTKYYHTLCVLAVGVAMLTSCLKDADNSSSADYYDVAITQFTLGTLNRYTSSVSSKTGNDTVVKSTVTGSNYKMTIDHLQKRIYNVLELPVGTDISHVVCTVSTRNGGVVAVKSMISDTLRWFSNTDSIDFSQPRVFRVISANGMSWRDYQVELNVSATTGTTFGWTLAANLGVPDPLPGCTKMGLVAQGDSVAWQCTDPLIGSSTNAVYTIDESTGLLMSLRQGDSQWQTEALADADSLLPVASKAAIVSWPYGPAANTDYVLMVGTPRQSNVTTMRVWRKIAPYEGGGQWVYMPVDEGNHYPLPLITQAYLPMAYHSGVALIVGDDNVVWQSVDQGITWRKSTTYALPSSVQGVVTSMTTDTQGRLWLLTTDGQLWKGAVDQ